MHVVSWERAWDTSTVASSEASLAAAGMRATGGSGPPLDNRRRLNDLFPSGSTALSCETIADVSRMGGVYSDAMEPGRRKGSLDLSNLDALTQLTLAQQSPRTVAERAKARRQIPEELSWDTNVRTSAARASYQSPRDPQNGSKANGIDNISRSGQQVAPHTSVSAILAKKREKWEADAKYTASLATANYEDTRSLSVHTSSVHTIPRPQEERGYEPAPAFPGRRASQFGDDYAAARRAHPQWRQSIGAGAPMPRR